LEFGCGRGHVASLGKHLLEPTCEIVVKHGSAFDSFQANDRHLKGIGATLIIRVDLRPPCRTFAPFAGSSAYSGTCERTPKPQMTAIIGRPFARTDFPRLGRGTPSTRATRADDPICPSACRRSL